MKEDRLAELLTIQVATIEDFDKLKKVGFTDAQTVAMLSLKRNSKDLIQKIDSMQP